MALREEGSYAEAERHFRKALDTLVRMPEPKRMEIAGAMAGVASVLLDTGRLDEAEDLLRKALDIDRAAAGEESVETALALTGIAEVFIKRGDIVRAEPLLRRSLAAYEKAVSHPADMATAYHELGTLYFMYRRYS